MFYELDLRAFGDLDLLVTGDLDFRGTGDLELRPAGDRDLRGLGDFSLSLRGNDRSLDLDVLFRGERDLLGDLLLDLPPPSILFSSVNRSFFPCSSVLSNLSKAASIPRRSENSTNPSPLRSL